MVALRMSAAQYKEVKLWSDFALTKQDLVCKTMPCWLLQYTTTLYDAESVSYPEEGANRTTSKQLWKQQGRNKMNHFQVTMLTIGFPSSHPPLLLAWNRFWCWTSSGSPLASSLQAQKQKVLRQSNQLSCCTYYLCGVPTTKLPRLTSFHESWTRLAFSSTRIRQKGWGQFQLPGPHMFQLDQPMTTLLWTNATFCSPTQRGSVIISISTALPPHVDAVIKEG